MIATLILMSKLHDVVRKLLNTSKTSETFRRS